ncbi:MAG TPA: tetratricopeptide repeat protein [Polyangia bacterium]|nr:tetratricopeptide repeat protein [Polyangia bacterium]
MIKKSWIVAALVMASFVAMPSLARGSSKKEQAEVHYDQGKAYYRAGAFDLAIQEFLEGYKLDPRAGVLFNIARGYEELKNRDKAIEFYKKYLDQGPAAAAATEARARMVVLERQAKEDDERKKVEAAEAERKRQPAPVAVAPAPVAPVPAPMTMPAPVETKPVAPAPAPVESVVPATIGETPAPAPAVAATSTPTGTSDPAHTMKVAGFVVGGVGVALLGAGTYFALHASSLKSDIGKEQTYSPSKDSDYKSAGTMAVVSFVGGAVAVAGGAVLYVLGANKEHGEAAPAATARLVPVATPNGGALFLSGRF